MENLQFYIDQLNDLSKEAGEISGSWNGDESGRQEDCAHIADEIVGKAERAERTAGRVEKHVNPRPSS
jgi:hypothetical protein